jgi:hypothetical protein
MALRGRTQQLDRHPSNGRNRRNPVAADALGRRSVHETDSGRSAVATRTAFHVDCTQEEKAKIAGGSAARIYHLKVSTLDD